MSANTNAIQAGSGFEPDAGPRKRVLIAVDDSSPAHRAVRVGGDLAAALLADVMLLHAVAPVIAAETPHLHYVLDDIRRGEGARILDRAARGLPGTLRVERVLVVGTPAEGILDHARRWQADFIVLGTRRRSRLSHFLLGSVAEAVMRKANCPVLTVGNGYDDDDDDDGPATSRQWLAPDTNKLFAVG